MSIDPAEQAVLALLDELLDTEGRRRALDRIARRVDDTLAGDSTALMAWEPVPMRTYGVGLPSSIFSSWVFALRAGAATGAERHPNSRQRMMSYRGAGDLQTKIGLKHDWSRHPLASDRDAPLEQRWISIPRNVWHQAVVAESNWVVISFHTASPNWLIEERPDPANARQTVQRRYMRAD